MLPNHDWLLGPNVADGIWDLFWQVTIALIAVIQEAVVNLNQATSSETVIQSNKHAFEAS
jgi:hypothetical protein